MMKPSVLRILVACLVALVVASCGGEAGSDETTTTMPAAVTTTTAAASEGDDTESGDGGTQGLGGLSSVCLEATQGMAAAMSAYSAGMSQAFGGGLDDDALQLAADQLEAMADAAPDEIKDDFAVISEQLGGFYTALAEMGYEPGVTPDAEQLEELSALAESIDNDAFNEASENINAWFEENC